MYNKETLKAISQFMITHNQTISVAESVTAGCLQTALSLSEGATQFFQGGITAYNIGQKCRHLHIEPVHALSCNCVSPKIAGDMATNVSKIFLSDWAIGITGYAAIIPEQNIRELFACYAFVHKGEIIENSVIKAKKRNPAEVQQYYTQYVLNNFIRVAKNTINTI